MMRGATWRTHSLRVAIAGLLTRFDRVTSLTHPAPQRSAPVEGGPAGTCPFRAGLVPLWRLPLWKLPLWKLSLWGLPSWGRPWPNLKATRGQGGFGQRRLGSGRFGWQQSLLDARVPTARNRRRWVDLRCGRNWSWCRSLRPHFRSPSRTRTGGRRTDHTMPVYGAADLQLLPAHQLCQHEALELNGIFTLLHRRLHTTFPVSDGNSRRDKRGRKRRPAH